MEKPLTPTQLRKDLYKVLDEVLETGQPREIVRGGHKLAIVPLGPRKRDLDRLPRREILLCTPDELESIHWNYVPEEGLLGDVP